MEYILPIAVENPPAVGSSEFKMLCQRASEAMRDRWESYRKRHIERLTGATIAVSDGPLVQQAGLEVDKGPLLSEVI